MYDSPHRHEITIYKVTVTENGLDQGWTVETLCDDALIWAGLTIATCPRAELAAPPLADPFKKTATTASEPLPCRTWAAGRSDVRVAVGQVGVERRQADRDVLRALGADEVAHPLARPG